MIFKNFSYQFKLPLSNILFPLGDYIGVQENEDFKINFSIVWMIIFYRAISRYKILLK